LKKRRIVLGFLVTLSVITFLDRLAIAVAGPRMQSELRIPPEKWGWVLGSFALAYGLFEIPSGALGDRIGQKSVLTRIVLWWSAFTALTAAAGNYVQLVVTQFLFGAGEAGAYPNASGVIARWFPVSERARAQGAVWAASRVGGALSPLLVLPLLHAVGWRGMFCTFAGLGITWAVLWRWWYHDRCQDQPGITAAELREIGAVQRRPRAEGLWKDLLRSRQARLVVAMYWCYVWASWFYFSWFPTYLVRGAGFTESEMGLLSALPFLLGCAGNIAGGILSDRLSARHGLKIGRCVLASSSLATSSLLILALAFTTRKPAVVVLASAGFGILDLMLPATWSLCLDLGRAHAGVLTGTMNTAGLAGGFVCTVLFGYLVRATGGYRAPLSLIAAMVMLSAVLYLWIDPHQPVWTEDPSPTG
jgi:ACS family glucarate transporter-like MFS transporter